METEAEAVAAEEGAAAAAEMAVEVEAAVVSFQNRRCSVIVLAAV